MRSYTVVGAGAIGGYYGARLQQSGLEVRFLARSDAAHLRDHGLRVDSPEGDVLLEVEVHT
ncbi:MAG TPA: 2-dehydropantoate 2-reductase N-terminal domain-containing protein, partial [Acidimicrobiales bacterium]|nr:2-dehydropantoate 2-reductase N-terminal domain-containing protein [Acidimicrobiales bacterium]